VLAQLIQRTGRLLCLALALGSLSGCAMFDWDKWNPETYRDDRARDIDSRLSEDRSIVQNPF
jgi:hypothetical protein